MKGILIKEFGGSEVLAYTDIDDPQPAADQVLIWVHTLGVNFADVKARTGANQSNGQTWSR
jgi:NADPH:quinone reductase-like Zn-dependent oxidoreductase